MRTIKSKYTDLTAKIMLAVVAVIMVGIILYYSMNFMNSTSEAAGHIIESTEKLSSEYAEYDVKMYDGEVLRGSEVVSFIKKHLGDYTSSETSPYYVKVRTVVSGTTYDNTYTNNVHLRDIKSFASMEYYIKPTVKFICQVDQTKNKAILGVSFIQK